jgi:hypothetical protein
MLMILCFILVGIFVTCKIEGWIGKIFSATCFSFVAPYLITTFISIIAPNWAFLPEITKEESVRILELSRPKIELTKTIYPELPTTFCIVYNRKNDRWEARDLILSKNIFIFKGINEKPQLMIKFKVKEPRYGWWIIPLKNRESDITFYLAIPEGLYRKAMEES